VLKNVSALSALLLLTLAGFAQLGKISGKILNEKNEPVPGVSIKITGSPVGVTSDIEGRFSISLALNKKYTLEFTAVGYASKFIEDAEPLSKDGNDLNVVLAVASKNLDLVTVTANRSNARKETTASLLQFQKNTNTVAAVISGESIRRSPDKNTSEVLKRVPGTSIQEGKYLIVRGLSDRYNQAMLNGIQLSSTEPDRKTFSFDLFPAAMVENIVINKAFVPEYPGEWAGGLVQVNTRDIPAANFLNIQLGTGFNTETIGKDFYTYKGGKYDWLGFDDGTRGLPDELPTKSTFATSPIADKVQLGKEIATNWSVQNGNVPLNASFQLAGGFNTKMFKKDVGFVGALTYNLSHRNLDFHNSLYSFNDNTPSLLFDYDNNKYSNDVLAGAMLNVAVKLNKNNKISLKNMLNVNSTDFVTLRTGIDNEQDPINGNNIRARELAMRSNTFFNTQILGEHNLASIKSKFNWYGGFTILDGYIPQQRRVQYNQAKDVSNAPYLLLISESRSQKTGSVFYSMLSDYIYNAGGDLTKTFTMFDRPQSVKAGYLFQVKDRLFDSRPFSIYLKDGTSDIKLQSEDEVFRSENFDAEDAKKFQFDELSGKQYRYMANSILNAGFIQLDNDLADWLRVVWGVRYEHFDQLVGSTNKNDERFANTKVGDFLPALNFTFKLNKKTNLRLSGSQTLVRPEFRELTNFSFYDFELGAGVVGLSTLERTKITNADLRYELYPRAGEVFTVGVFYKHFDHPIEIYFNQSGVATNTFNYLNADQADSYGAEFELRKKLDFVRALKNFTFQTNISYIYNRVKTATKTIDRPMQGQSPYVLNAGLQYDVPKLGIFTNLLFNQIGRRILYVGNEVTPEIWEAPRPLLDLQVGKKLMNDRAEIKLNVSDILNHTAYFYHDVDANKKFKSGSADALAISRKYGTNINIVFGYTFK